eukprot:GHVU01008688.1.p2 GENE.GHVU01008688.1~~GHVU01008688.1.p2  ORF type:complete len:118 (-),score=10.51 GHVU01008688.1:526-879(-)
MWGLDGFGMGFEAAEYSETRHTRYDVACVPVTYHYLGREGRPVKTFDVGRGKGDTPSHPTRTPFIDSVVDQSADQSAVRESRGASERRSSTECVRPRQDPRPDREGTCAALGGAAGS